MDKEQNLVVEFRDGPAAVLAGAGSGKTSTLIGRIKNLSQTVDPERIVMLTFTNAAADEMKERASKVNEKCQRVIACTYHKYCGKMLRTFGKVIGIEPYFEVLTEMKYKTLIEYVKSQSGKYDELKDFPSATKLASIFSTLVNNEDVTLKELIEGKKYSIYEQEIAELREEVRLYGLANQKLCFDDMLIYMNQLLDNEEVCKTIAKTFDYLMVDEFQDTNKLQLDILLKLGKYNRNIVVVGDISQSIYKFRGARVQNIENFISYFAGCQIFTLSTNYRSTQEILDASNSMMHNFATWRYTDMKANDKNGAKPFLLKHGSDSDQAQWVIGNILHYQSKGYKLSDIAVIERKSMSSFKLENELAKAHIPFEKRGGMKFTEYACVDDMLSFFSVLLKNDKFSWFNVLKLVPGVGNKTASEIAEYCKRDHFFDLYYKRKFYPDLKLLEHHISQFHVKDFQILFDEVADYYFELRTKKIEGSKMSSSARFDAYDKIEKDKKVIAVLKDMASTYQSVGSFLEDIALDAVKSNEDDENKDKMIITTIHSAKGLEWPVVMIIDCIETDMEDEKEELRCMYVAMTRAKSDLYLSIPVVTHVNGKINYNEFIRFIKGSESYFIRGRV